MNKMMAGLAGIGLLIGIPGIGHANLVTNGGFEQFTSNGNGTSAGGQLGYNTTATGWSVPAPNNSYTFLFTPGTADNGGVTGQYGNLQLWGANNGGANTLTTSPDGGNFIGMDSAYQVGALTQTISGLTVGQDYAVSFYWAAAQQYGFTGPTYDNWSVSLGGGASQTTSTINLANHSFSGWQQQTFDYTATSTSETLSFLAGGGPGGVPPFALLDGVAMNLAPEGNALCSMCAGLIGVGLCLRRRARVAKSGL